MIFSHGSNHSRGVLVLQVINELLKHEINDIVIDEKGRFMLLEMTIQESPFFKKFYLLFKVLILIQNVGSSLAGISMFI